MKEQSKIKPETTELRQFAEQLQVQRHVDVQAGWAALQQRLAQPGKGSISKGKGGQRKRPQ